MKTKFLTTLLLTVMGAIVLTSAKFSGETGYKIGDKAADFKLKNVDGKMKSMADYKDSKGFIIVFTCNHCPFAKAYEDRIIALDKKYASQGYPVIAINPNDATQVDEDSFDNMVKRAKEKNYPFPYLADETQATTKAYGAARTPHVFIVSNKNGEHIVQYIGAIDDNTDNPSAVKTKYAENALDELLAGKMVSNNSTKAIGCTIKWKK